MLMLFFRLSLKWKLLALLILFECSVSYAVSSSEMLPPAVHTDPPNKLRLSPSAMPSFLQQKITVDETVLKAFQERRRNATQINIGPAGYSSSDDIPVILDKESDEEDPHTITGWLRHNEQRHKENTGDVKPTPVQKKPDEHWWEDGENALSQQRVASQVYLPESAIHSFSTTSAQSAPKETNPSSDSEVPSGDDVSDNTSGSVTDGAVAETVSDNSDTVRSKPSPADFSIPIRAQANAAINQTGVQATINRVLSASRATGDTGELGIVATMVVNSDGPVDMYLTVINERTHTAARSGGNEDEQIKQKNDILKPEQLTDKVLKKLHKNNQSLFITLNTELHNIEVYVVQNDRIGNFNVTTAQPMGHWFVGFDFPPVTSTTAVDFLNTQLMKDINYIIETDIPTYYNLLGDVVKNLDSLTHPYFIKASGQTTAPLFDALSLIVGEFGHGAVITLGSKGLILEMAKHTEAHIHDLKTIRSETCPPKAKSKPDKTSEQGATKSKKDDFKPLYFAVTSLTHHDHDQAKIKALLDIRTNAAMRHIPKNELLESCGMPMGFVCAFVLRCPEGVAESLLDHEIVQIILSQAAATDSSAAATLFTTGSGNQNMVLTVSHQTMAAWFQHSKSGAFSKGKKPAQ